MLRYSGRDPGAGTGGRDRRRRRRLQHRSTTSRSSGWTRLVLVEQFQLTHGSTWHSAGLVGQLRSSVSLTRMMQYSVGLYAELQRADRQGSRAGTSSAACGSPPRRRASRRSSARPPGPRPSGCRWRSSRAAEAQELFPPMSTDGVLAAAFLPRDGYLDPSQLTFALADGARRWAPRSRRARASPASSLRDGRVAAVVTDKGAIECEVVVNAAGMYAPRRRRGSSASTCRSSRSATSTSSPSRSTRRSSRCRRCATPTTSSTSAPRSAAS